MAKQSFLGLVKISGEKWQQYLDAKDAGTGKIIFADITGTNAGKYIYANGIEYKVADSTNLDELIKRVADVSQYAIDSSNRLNDLSTFVRKNVDASVLDLSTRVGTLETWKSVVDGSIAGLDTSVKNHEGRITALENASTALAGRIADVSQDVINISTYVHNTVDTSINDISTRLSNVGITAADNKLSVNGKDVSLSGSDYVNVTAADNSVNVSLNAEKIQDGGSGTGHEKLATKGYVDEQIAVLEQALVFICDISTGNVTSKLTDNEVKAGYTYVATDAGEYDGQKFESGDLIIVKADAQAGTPAEIIVVERNLNGAVTAGAALDNSKLVVGTGAQGVKTIDVTAEDLATAIANANSAIQGVKAADTQNDYVKISVENSTDSSTKDVSAVLSVVDTSADLASVNTTGKLVDAKAVKDLVDAKAAEIKVQATLNSSTPTYVDASASVDATGRIITAGVGVKTATLIDASNGTDGLATAKDVYKELTAVENVIAAANATMSNTIGLNPDYSVTWSDESGIALDTSIVKAIEEVAKKAEQAKHSGVTSFAGKTGDITLAAASQTAGDINLSISQDGSVLNASIVDLQGYVAKAIDTSIQLLDVATTEVADKVLVGVSETDGKIASTATALEINGQAFTHAVDAATMSATINGSHINVSGSDTSTIADRIAVIDASVNALEGATYVRTVTGESETLSNANDAYVNVAATTDAQGNVTLDSSVQLANPIESKTHEAATGLATDGWVKDFLAWEVIE